ncbi:hypothetical protein [uncultured Paraglaciecola sp.]|uniref:hypothetical protein n=1 Tax=uncultured Paraglaciecola sp. TaxID=1765024 RepID=UPI00262F1AB6|nr:hypothetical protein [uncultured Paraglaciecola sp.]
MKKALVAGGILWFFLLLGGIALSAAIDKQCTAKVTPVTVDSNDGLNEITPLNSYTAHLPLR